MPSLGIHSKYRYPVLTSLKLTRSAQGVPGVPYDLSQHDSVLDCFTPISSELQLVSLNSKTALPKNIWLIYISFKYELGKT